MRNPEAVNFAVRILVPLRNESGISLVLVLVMMAVLGLSAGMAGNTWSNLTRRAREADLLWKGDQIRKALGSYYRFSHGQGAPNIYPSRIDYLLKDPRSLQTIRHLRRLYVDPMTGKDWVLIKDQAGRIRGVRSSFSGEPFKQDNFSEENVDFKGRTNYREWEFIHVPKKSSPAVKKPPTGEVPQPAAGNGSPHG